MTDQMNITCTLCGHATRLALKSGFDDRFGYPGYFDMMRCLSCGLYETTPKLKFDDIARLYTDFYPRKNMRVEDIRKVQDSYAGISRARSPRIHQTFQKFQDWFYGKHDAHRFIPQDLSRGSRVLDIGCGEGKSLFEIKAMGYDAYGVDPDKNIIPIRDALKLPIFIGTIEEYSTTGASFDCIVASQLIEHITDTKAFLKTCGILLKENGILIMSTPNIESIWRKIFGRRWTHWHIPYHQQIFSKKSMRLFLESNSFETLGIRMSMPTQWSFHQLLSLRYNPVMGQKNPYWNKRTSNTSDITSDVQISTNSRSKKMKVLLKVLLSAKRILHFTLSITFSIMNRIVDAIGWGDCMIVIARKK